MGTPFTSADQLIGKTPLLELTRLEQKHGLAARIPVSYTHLSASASRCSMLPWIPPPRDSRIS